MLGLRISKAMFQKVAGAATVTWSVNSAAQNQNRPDQRMIDNTVYQYLNNNNNMEIQKVSYDIPRADENTTNAIFTEMTVNPPSVHEVESTVEAFKENKIHDVLPRHITDCGDQFVLDMWDKVANGIVSNPKLIESARNKMTSSRPVTFNAPAKVELSAWEQYAESNRCALCLDLYAAPVLLNCSHSLCGMCYEELHGSCSSLDVEICHKCVECKTNIEHHTFNRGLDEVILKGVDSIPDCEQKTAWKQRREEYMILKNKNQRKTYEETKKDRESHQEDEENEQYWRSMQEMALPIFAFAVIAVIWLTRKV